MTAGNVTPKNNQNIIPDIRKWPFAKEIRNFSTPVFPVRHSGNFAVLKGYPDPELLLESAYDTVKRYLRAAGYSESETADCRIETRYAPTEVFESWELDFSAQGCVISAGDTEGIRRGLYEFADLLSAGNGAFPAAGQKISRRPFLKTRLGRCPFSPVKRKPVNVDELLEKTDYYPDALLDTLAHSGVNGIWIVTALRELGQTSLLADDPQRERRIAKLRKTAIKCRKYGIRLYLFMIEPFSVTESDPLFKEHRDMFSADPDTNRVKYGWCPASPLTRKYLFELLRSIFTEVPELGGVVNITLGERTTTCLPAVPNRPLTISCRSRCGWSAGEIIRNSLQAMRDGIKAGSPDAELIAWFYLPQAYDPADWVKGISAFMPEGVIPQFNFESGGQKEQLGKTRVGGDYWISYDGPAPRFRAEAEVRRGQPMGAKLQLGCGYELSIVPGIPVPSVVYRKYRELSRLGITHVMQSWYLGNFPNMMTRAMGLASFREDDSSMEDEDAFLLRLALPDWREDAPSVIRAWKLFDAAYQNFPFSLVFQYYAPQHNMSEWRFHFLPDLEPLAEPWIPTSIPGGDAVGEALGSFTLEEATESFERLIRLWRKGMEELLPLEAKYAGNRERERDFGIAKLLLYQFQGTLNLLHFFELRRRLYVENDKSHLTEMTAIVHDQQRIFRAMIPLLEADSRLGFHGEALTRLFDEHSVRKAIAEADRALETAEEIRNSPLAPVELVFQRGVWKKIVPEWRTVAPGFKWKHEISNGELSIRLSCPANSEYILMLWFMDAPGCGCQQIDYLQCENGILKYLWNSLLHTQGCIGDTGIRLGCEKPDEETTERIFSWPLKKLPAVDPRLPYLRFNLCLQLGKDFYFAFGKGMGFRLLQGKFSPHEGGCLEIPC